MVFFTQLVYVNPGQERVFDEFEAIALPLVDEHGGELLLRLRLSGADVIAGSIELPYEIHLVRFPGEEAFSRFVADERRQRFLHLKNASVRSSLLIRGTT